MNDAGPRQTWADGGAYEQYIGRWSRVVAPQVIAWMSAPQGAAWLDAGCGTGALTQAILDAGASRVIGVDRSPPYVAYARAQVRDRRAHFAVGDMARLPVAGASVDAVASGLVLNFLADPAAGVAEMVRVLRPGGTAGCYVWDYAGRMDLIRTFWSAAVALDPEADVVDEAKRFPAVCALDALAALFAGAGLRDVAVDTVDVTATFPSAAAAWEPFLGGQGPAPSYLATLDESRRERVRAEFVARLPVADDGSVSLLVRALAARGRAAG